jgi:hypothetical protein
MLANPAMSDPRYKGLCLQNPAMSDPKNKGGVYYKKDAKTGMAAY